MTRARGRPPCFVTSGGAASCTIPQNGYASADTVRSCTLRVDGRHHLKVESTTHSRRGRTASAPTSGTAYGALAIVSDALLSSIQGWRER
ncbi:uncharacterized protein PHACADRAFT_262580 [Phanerochaete carnosa HHB-10118-sp]|uniref:Uncharacterized protein n=1 Tax=Phanerochaete carnosa (strain HHB-10118-sp) TaxID=650164 RepID=K5VZQ7_PHACS|nr:uncharacterized protein PHACADRAFT_262580 [Phanerochaete carnosa HHB-10118-sp]EKM52109.1 hypothetical protein PHACADRAFT_262580 [Phanerochaete carnosa HHB-10118-sp]